MTASQALSMILIGAFLGVWFAAWRQVRLERRPRQRPHVRVYDWEREGVYRRNVNERKQEEAVFNGS